MIEDKNLKSEFHINEQTVVNGIVHTRAAEKDYFDHKYEFGEKLGQLSDCFIFVSRIHEPVELIANPNCIIG